MFELDNMKVNKLIKTVNSIENISNLSEKQLKLLVYKSQGLISICDDIFSYLDGEEDKVVDISLIENIESDDIKKIMKAYLKIKKIAILDLSEVQEDIDENEELPEKEANGLDIVHDYLSEIGKIPLLTPEEEKDLFNRYKNGEDVREKIINSNLKLVVKVAKGYNNSSVQFIDLIQEGNMGLMKAIEKFDVDRGYKFSTYAMWWIRQSMGRYIADHSRVIRVPVHANEKINRVKRFEYEYKVNNGKAPSIKELAELTGYTEEQVKNIKITDLTPTSLETPVGEGEHGVESILEDFIPDETYSVEEAALNITLRESLLEVLNELPERERLVIALRFGIYDGRERTLEEIGQIYHVTRERIRQIEAKTLRMLRHPSRAKKLKEYISG